MPHEVVQVIKLIKYNRKSDEMISVTCKYMPTTVNTQEQTLTWNDAVSEPNHYLVFTARIGTDLRIIPWTSLRIAIISGPQRARIRIGSGSPATVRISPNKSETLQYATKHMNSHKHTLVHVYTPQYTRIHICVQPHIYVYKYTHTPTYMHTYLN